MQRANVRVVTGSIPLVMAVILLAHTAGGHVSVTPMYSELRFYVHASTDRTWKTVAFGGEVQSQGAGISPLSVTFEAISSPPESLARVGGDAQAIWSDAAAGRIRTNYEFLLDNVSNPSDPQFNHVDFWDRLHPDDGVFYGSNASIWKYTFDCGGGEFHLAYDLPARLYQPCNLIVNGAYIGTCRGEFSSATSGQLIGPLFPGTNEVILNFQGGVVDTIGGRLVTGSSRNNTFDWSIVPTQVPAPSAILLATIGAGSMGWLGRRRAI